MNELKPCPFCGVVPPGAYYHGYPREREKRTHFMENPYNGHRVFCRNPHCWVHVSTDVYKRAEDAIEAWNRRASDGAERKTD